MRLKFVGKRSQSETLSIRHMSSANELLQNKSSEISEDIVMEEKIETSAVVEYGSSKNCLIDNVVTERPLMWGCDDTWTWNKRDRSQEVRLSGPNCRTVHFHPNWSKGTAGIRGTRILNNGRYYWEIKVSQRVFGTSMMFGICTKKARVHANSFTNLLGEDKNGWGLSHKGLLWHNGEARSYTKRFKENEATTIGILFDGVTGFLTYYKDGVCLGVAFRGLNEIREPLYPIVCSTAAKTEMTLAETRRDFVNLQDRCRAVIMQYIKSEEELQRLGLPQRIIFYLQKALNPPATPITPVENLFDFYMF